MKSFAEVPVSEIDWDPDTCTCDLEIIRFEQDGWAPEDVAERDVEIRAAREAVARARTAVRGPTVDGPKVGPSVDLLVGPRPRKSGKTRVLTKDGQLREEIPRKGRHPGKRTRAKIVNRCPEHAHLDPNAAVFACWCKTPVCKCRWLKLVFDADSGRGRFGHKMLFICERHRALPSSEVLDVIRAEAAALNSE